MVPAHHLAEAAGKGSSQRETLGGRLGTAELGNVAHLVSMLMSLTMIPVILKVSTGSLLQFRSEFERRDDL